MLTHDYDSDGEITIGSVGGGKGAIRYELKNSKGTTIGVPAFASSNLVLKDLSSDLIGYTLRIYDESVPVTECITTGLTITGPSVLILSYTKTNNHCYGENNGEIKINVQGGVSPYRITVVGQGYSSSGLLATGLATGQYTVSVVDSIGSGKTETVNIGDENPELIISKPTTESDISTQCDATQYKIPFDITAGVSSSKVNVEYSVDAGDTWILKLLDNTGGRYILDVPRASVNSTDGVLIRFWVDAIVRYDAEGIALPPCYSEELVYEISEMTLPPDISTDPYIKDGLGTSYTPALEAIYHNLRQCDSTKGTYTFSIAALDRGFTYRAPYTIEYRVENINGTSTFFTHYTGLATITGNRVGTANNKVDFYVKITDNKGCVYPTTGWHKATVTLPSETLDHVITTTGGFPNYKHTLKVTGGIPPLKLGGNVVINAGDINTYTTASLVFVSTVTDKNGCVINIIG
jgi:hypothetical protein